MASGIGRTLRAAIQAALFKSSSLTAIASTYVSLHTASPGVDGQTLNEPSGNNYARAQVTINTGWTTPTAAEPSMVENVAAIIFNAASGSWGTINHFGLWSHASSTSAANFLWSGAFTTPQAIASGNVATIPIGDLEFNLNWTP